jgi:hypothetical protein
VKLLVTVKLPRLLLLGIASLALTVGLRAQFMLTLLNNTSTFSGSEQVLGFNSLTSLTPIATQFTGQGATFDSALIASTNSGDTNLFPANADGVIATNWDGTPALTWKITFAAPQIRAGFLVEMNTSDVLQLSTSLGGTSHGSVTYTSLNVTPVFFGVSDAAMFDTLTFTVSGPDNHFFAMDNFRYESVPEPPVWLLLSAGLAAMGWAAKVGRQRRKAG